MPGDRPRSAASSRRRKSVRVWGEVGLTVAITEDPPQYVKVLFGHERIAPNDDETTIKRYTRMVDSYNEAEVERQVEKYKRLALAVSGGEVQPTSSHRGGRRQ